MGKLKALGKASRSSKSANVSGSTLIETIIALIILLIISSLAFSLFINATSSINAKSRINAILAVNAYSDSTRDHKDYALGVWNTKELTITRVVTKYPKAEGLILVEFQVKAYDGHEILNCKELFRDP